MIELELQVELELQGRMDFKSNLNKSDLKSNLFKHEWNHKERRLGESSNPSRDGATPFIEWDKLIYRFEWDSNLYIRMGLG